MQHIVKHCMEKDLAVGRKKGIDQSRQVALFTLSLFSLTLLRCFPIPRESEHVRVGGVLFIAHASLQGVIAERPLNS